MTKGRRRLYNALLITTTIACPVGLDNGEVCSGHGACAEHVSKGIDETCICDYGFSGPDCSLRLCPAARAWSDYASSNNTAHAKHVECANMGEISASRGAVVPSRHRRDSSPSDEAVGGFFFDFEAVRTASRDRDAPRRRLRPGYRFM